MTKPIDSGSQSPIDETSLQSANTPLRTINICSAAKKSSSHRSPSSPSSSSNKRGASPHAQRHRPFKKRMLIPTKLSSGIAFDPTLPAIQLQNTSPSTDKTTQSDAIWSASKPTDDVLVPPQRAHTSGISTVCHKYTAGMHPAMPMAASLSHDVVTTWTTSPLSVAKPGRLAERRAIQSAAMQKSLDITATTSDSGPTPVECKLHPVTASDGGTFTNKHPACMEAAPAVLSCGAKSKNVSAECAVRPGKTLPALTSVRSHTFKTHDHNRTTARPLTSTMAEAAISPSSKATKKVHFEFPEQPQASIGSVSFDTDFGIPSPTPLASIMQESQAISKVTIAPKNDSNLEKALWMNRVISTPNGLAMLLVPNENISLEDYSMLASMVAPSFGRGTATKCKHWTATEDEILTYAVGKNGEPPHDWGEIARMHFPTTRNANQCKNRWKKLNPATRQAPFSAEEDALIVKSRGQGLDWLSIANQLPGRTQDQIRSRFANVLDPTLVKNVAWTATEDNVLYTMRTKLGNKWKDIATHLPGRSANDVKNRWHNGILKQNRLVKQLNKKKEREAKLAVLRSRSALSTLHAAADESRDDECRYA